MDEWVGGWVGGWVLYLLQNIGEPSKKEGDAPSHDEIGWHVDHGVFFVELCLEGRGGWAGGWVSGRRFDGWVGGGWVAG